MNFPQSSNSATLDQARSVVFLDGNVQDYQVLMGDVLPGVEVVLLDGARDGVAQMTAALEGRRDVESVHVVSHGRPGGLLVGDGWLDGESLERYRESLRGWGRSLSGSAQVLLYGCNVAADEIGAAFVRRFAELTGAVVAASRNLTGSAALGGDWELEVRTGEIAARAVFGRSGLESYGHVLTDVEVSDVIVEEGNSGSKVVNFRVSLNAPAAAKLIVNYAITERSATVVDGDYVASATGALTFTVGDTQHLIAVTINGDAKVEADETFIVKLSNPGSEPYTITKSLGFGVILNDDSAVTPPLPATLAIGNASVTEGDAGTVNLVFTVTRSGDVSQVSTVDYATVDGTAGALDYVANSGTLTFAAGVTTQTVTVAVQGDTLVEGSESLSVQLTPRMGGNATITTAKGTGTIIDNDVVPAPGTLAIENVSVTEGDNGTQNVIFRVTRSGNTGLAASVLYATANGTALAGEDYVAASGTLNFVAGETVQTITVIANGDDVVEGDETFFVDLSGATNASVTTAQGTGTLTNDDIVPGSEPSVSIDDVSLSEGNTPTTANLTATLSAASVQTITVAYATADGTAIGGEDYGRSSGVLTFAPGVLTQTIAVPIRGDLNVEGNENFVVNLSNPTNVKIGDGQGNGLIVNDDIPPVLSVNDVTVTEGDNGAVNAAFTISMNLISNQSVSVEYQTVDGTATVADGDYVAIAPTFVTFNPGETNKIVNVSVKGDTKFEGNENFSLKLTQSLNATIAKVNGVATIVNNDKQVTPPAPTPTPTPKPTTPGDVPSGGTGNVPKSNQFVGTPGDDNLSGTNLADMMVGNDGNDVLRGLGGDDLIFGSNGNDQLFGGEGNDVIYGRDGQDKMFGEAGNDVLIGGFRNDVLTGGAGKDRFEFRRKQQGIDQVVDFSVVDDTLAFRGRDFKSGLKVGILTEDQFRLGSRALDKGDRIIYDGKTGGLFFDADGSGGMKQIQLAQLNKGLNLTRQDCLTV